jgi:hypothetical protein
MRANQWITSVSIAAIGLLASAPALAQKTTGVPGSPDATTTIDGRYLPTPDQPFQGEIIIAVSAIMLLFAFAILVAGIQSPLNASLAVASPELFRPGRNTCGRRT